MFLRSYPGPRPPVGVFSFSRTGAAEARTAGARLQERGSQTPFPKQSKPHFRAPRTNPPPCAGGSPEIRSLHPSNRELLSPALSASQPNSTKPRSKESLFSAPRSSPPHSDTPHSDTPPSTTPRSTASLPSASRFCFGALTLFVVLSLVLSQGCSRSSQEESQSPDTQGRAGSHDASQTSQAGGAPPRPETPSAGTASAGASGGATGTDSARAGRNDDHAVSAATSPGTPLPGRIVSLAPNITEILFALGVGTRVVGVTDFCNEPPEVLTLPKVGGFVNPNIETILDLRPDLVIATPNVGNKTFVERLLRVGARVEIVQARNVEEIFPAIEAIARVTGVAEAGSRLAARIRADLDREIARASRLPRCKALFCIQVEPLLVAGRGSYPGDLLELAGGENIVPSSAGAYPTFSLEAVVAAAPDVIVQTLMDTRDGAASDASLMAYWRKAPTIPAVRSKRLHIVKGDVVLRPGPRVAEGVAALIALLHPESRAEADSHPAAAASGSAGSAISRSKGGIGS